MHAFDNDAWHYDDWYSTRMGTLVDEVETSLMWDLLIPLKGMHILDVGCGTGNYSIKLAQLGCKVTGIDISKQMLDIATVKAKEHNLNIDFINAPSEKIPFEDETFDGILSVTAFEFIINKKESIDEMFRVAKKEAPIVVGTINGDSVWGEMYRSKEFRENTVFKYADFLTKKAIASYKSEKLIEIKTALHFPPDIKEHDMGINIHRDYHRESEAGFIGVLWTK